MDRKHQPDAENWWAEKEDLVAREAGFKDRRDMRKAEDFALVTGIAVRVGALALAVLVAEKLLGKVL